MATAPNIIHFKGPDGTVTPIDLEDNSPDSPDVKAFIAGMLQKGFTMAEGPQAVREPPPPPTLGSPEQMQAVGPQGLRDIFTGGVAVGLENLGRQAMGPSLGTLEAGPLAKEIAQGLVPQNEQQLMKESLLALTGFAGTPTKIASKLALSIGRALSPALIDLATGKEPNSVEVALVGMGELGTGAARWVKNTKFGSSSIRQEETMLGDGLTNKVSELLPDVDLGKKKTQDLYGAFASETFGDSKPAVQLGKRFDELDKVIDSAFNVGAKGGVEKTIDLSTNPQLQMAVEMYRKNLPGGPRLLNNQTTTIVEARKAMHYAGDVAFDYAKAPGTVEQTATGASMRALAEGAKEEYKKLVERHAGPDVLARLEALDEQYKGANLLHSIFSPAVNKEMYHITRTGPRIKLEHAKEIMSRAAELEKRGMGDLTQIISHGRGPGVGAEIGGLNPRVSGAPFGKGLGFAGAQLQIHTLHTPVTKPPRNLTGPIDAGLLRLLEASGWTGEE